MYKNKKGLTLIEVIAVLAIISLLFIMLVPNITSSFEKSKTVSVEKDFKNYEDIFTVHLLSKPSLDIESVNEDLELEYIFDENNLSREVNAFGSPYELIRFNKNQVVIKSDNNKNVGKKYFVLHMFYEEGRLTSKVLGTEKKLDEEAYKEVEDNVALIDDGQPPIYVGENRPNNNGSGTGGSGTGGSGGTGGSTTPPPPVVTDETPPHITVSPNGSTLYKKNYNVTVTVADESDIASTKYQWTTSDSPTESWEDLLNSETIVSPSGLNGSYFLFVKSVDEFGNEALLKSEPYLFDNVVPTLTISMNGSANPKSNYSLTLSSSDSDIASVQYSWSNSPALPSSWVATNLGNLIYSPTVDNDSILYLHVKVMDNSENEFLFVSNGFAFDVSGPSISLSKNGNNDYEKNVNTILEASDTSGIGLARYSWSTSSTTAGNWNAINVNESIPSPTNTQGEYYLHIQVQDSIGNVSNYVSNTFYIDTKGPVVSSSVNGSVVPQRSYSVVVSSDDSDIQEIFYSWSKDRNAPSSWTSIGFGGVVNSPALNNDSLFLHTKAVDSLGNESLSVSNIFAFDNAKPTVTLSKNGNSAYERIVQTTVTATDNSSIASVKYSWSTSDLTPSTWVNSSNNSTITAPTNTSGILYLHVQVEDSVGNITNLVSNSFRIDNVAPTVTFSPNSNSTAAKTHSTTISVSDVASSITSIKYAWSTKTSNVEPNIATSNNSTVTSPRGAGNYYLHITAVDSSGNSITKVSGAFVLHATEEFLASSCENRNITETAASQFTFSTTSDGSGIILKSYNGTEQNLVPPCYINGLPVVQIGDGSTKFSPTILQSVTIPSTVKTIKDNAFGYHNLAKIYIPISVTEIGYQAFSNNPFVSIVIEDSSNTSDRLTLGKRVFAFSSSGTAPTAEKLVVPSRLLTVPEETFQNRKFNSIVIKNGVQTIGISAFYNVDIEVDTITIPKSVTVIDEQGFWLTNATNIVFEGYPSVETEAFYVSSYKLNIYRNGDSLPSFSYSTFNTNTNYKPNLYTNQLPSGYVRPSELSE